MGYSFQTICSKEKLLTQYVFKKESSKGIAMELSRDDLEAGLASPKNPGIILLIGKSFFQKYLRKDETEWTEICDFAYVRNSY